MPDLFDKRAEHDLQGPVKGIINVPYDDELAHLMNDAWLEIQKRDGRKLSRAGLVRELVRRAHEHLFPGASDERGELFGCHHCGGTATEVHLCAACYKKTIADSMQSTAGMIEPPPPPPSEQPTTSPDPLVSMTETARKRFRETWRRLARKGECDALDGTEYHRVLLAFIEAGQRGILTDFIRQHSNQGATTTTTEEATSDTAGGK